MTRARFVMMVLALAFVGATASAQTPPAQPQGTARITGKVTRADGRPIAAAIIRWVRWEGGRGMQGSGRAGADGVFVLDKLLAGSYQLTAQAEGFVTSEFGQTVAGQPGKRIDIVDAQTFEHADITLLKTSAIEGVITDEFGDPVPGVTVQMGQVQFVAGANRLMPVGGPAPQPSDDRGHYRVTGLAPGEYYVMVLSGAFAQPETSAGFAPTFYPGTAAPADARAVRVAAGQDASDISFALTPAVMRTVTGRVTDPAGAPVTASVMLAATSNGDVRAIIMARTQAGPDGAFTFRNVPEGSYVVQGFGRPESGGSLATSPFGAAVVSVQRDVTDMRVAIRPGSLIRGRILFEGDATGLKPDAVLISGAPAEFITGPLVGGGPPRTTIREDWSFETRDMFGVRTIRASVGAPGWYLKSVVIAGQDKTDTPVDFRSGDVNDVEITLSRRPAGVTGTVMDGETPVREYTVVVFSDDPAKWTFQSRFLQIARPSPADGSFRATSLPAGGYLVAALSTMTQAQAQDPVFLESIRAQATRVTLNDGETKAVTLRIIKR